MVLKNNKASINSKKGKVLIALNTAWNLFNFRIGLIHALIADGYEVVAVAPKDEYASHLTESGCRFISIPMDNKGTHPGRDLLLLIRFWLMLKQERPDVFLGYTVKPNIYGSLVAHTLGIPVINNIAGLGTVFIRDAWLTRLVKLLYMAALSRSRHVFFQNNEDRQLFIGLGLVKSDRTSRLPGSGVDLNQFCYTPMRLLGGTTFRFLLVARMLLDKGIGEYVEAARIVRRKYPTAKFQLLGFLDVKNPTAVSKKQMDSWVSEGIVEYLGIANDVKPYLISADCVVLPSYREGVPRSLLEAAAIGRPIIASDAIGCRDVVDDMSNGLLCRVGDADDLAAKMLIMIEMSPEKRREMGLAGRKKMELEFDEQVVIKCYLDVINTITYMQSG